MLKYMSKILSKSLLKCTPKFLRDIRRGQRPLYAFDEKVVSYRQSGVYAWVDLDQRGIGIFIKISIHIPQGASQSYCRMIITIL